MLFAVSAPDVAIAEVVAAYSAVPLLADRDGDSETERGATSPQLAFCAPQRSTERVATRRARATRNGNNADARLSHDLRDANAACTHHGGS